MNILEIITKKREKKVLTKSEIEYFINNYTNGTIPDYQASALIMAIYLNGLNDKELYNLTFSMANSGEMMNLSEFGENVVDKHSTGGVGDKVSIILLPIIASLGIPVAKMSGRGLGFTGGTTDKLESIKGYKTNLSITEFKENVNKIGISIIGQTLNLAPADKKIYALRDSIGCVDNISLIASSIMSKKIALGANKIVLEVTYGKGAFMKTLKDAKKLATKMEKIGELAGRTVKSVFTPMNEPIGYSIGNALEIKEAIEFFKGLKMAEDLKNAVLNIGSEMLKLANLSDSIEKSKEIIEKEIKDGKAFNKFKELVKMQGGDVSYLENTNKFEKSKYEIDVFSNKEGIIREINAEEIGKLACSLGAGRIKKEDTIDLSAGIELNKKVGEKIKLKEKIGTIYTNNKEKVEFAKKRLLQIYKIS